MKVSKFIKNFHYKIKIKKIYAWQLLSLKAKFVSCLTIMKFTIALRVVYEFGKS